MKVLYIQVLLEKNEHCSTPVWIYPWEVPVFAAVHRKSGVTEIGKRVFEKRVAPRADAEFDRLAQRYKGPEGSDVTYVASIYGHGSLGLRKLQEAMAEAAKETAAVAAAERDNPTPAAPVNGTEFESPFGDEPEIADQDLGIETQADIRKFVDGDDAGATTVEAAA